MTIDLCWQSFWTFVREYPAFFTAVAFIVFWFLRFAFGHKCYQLTCWAWTARGGSFIWLRRRLDMHDWMRAGDSHIRVMVCNRCGTARRW